MKVMNNETHSNKILEKLQYRNLTNFDVSGFWRWNLSAAKYVIKCPFQIISNITKRSSLSF